LTSIPESSACADGVSVSAHNEDADTNNIAQNNKIILRIGPNASFFDFNGRKIKIINGGGFIKII
jgi:hypothetical protein